MIEHAIIVALSTFSVTYLMKENFDGPFDVLHKIRNWATEIRSDGLNYARFFGPLFVCYWCLSMWTCLVISIIYSVLIGVGLREFPFLLLASYALSGILYEYVMGR